MDILALTSNLQMSLPRLPLTLREQICIAFSLSSLFPALKTLHPGNPRYYVKTKSKNNRRREKDTGSLLSIALSIYLTASLQKQISYASP